MMESGKRSKNFTEREKMLLIEVAKEFLAIIDNKKTDGASVEAKKQAWMALTNKYNAVSETGIRTKRQLHALYDNIKKKARKNMSNDKCEMYKTGGGTFTPKTTAVDEKIVALLTPQFKPLPNELDSSAPYYKLDEACSHENIGTSQDVVVVFEAGETLTCQNTPTSKDQCSSKQPISPLLKEVECTPQVKKSLTETKKKVVHNVSASIIKRKTHKQLNKDLITNKRLEILEVQRQHELLKLEKTKILLDLDIELKKALLENAKIDLEFKKKNFNL